MLSLLHISHFAIVDQLDIEFAPGFTVITGETGAGKSILMDALSLCLGDRADAGMVRAGSNRAEISATFSLTQLPEALAWLRERDLDEEQECTLRRSINSDGRSRGFINGKPATLSDLRELGELLIDIHSQHEHQTLLRKDSHRKLLDSYGKLSGLAKNTSERYGDWHRLDEQLKHIQRHHAEQQARLEILAHLCNELDTLNLGQGEYAAIEQRHDALANIGSLQSDGAAVLHLLQDSDDSSALASINQALRILDSHTGRSPALASAHELLMSAKIHIEEVVPTLRSYLDDLDADPLEQQQLEQRLAHCHQLARKHRVSPDELPQVYLALCDERAQLEQQRDVTQLARDCQAAEAAYRAEAETLRQQRQHHAAQFCLEAQQFLADLGMPQAKLALQFTPLSKPSAHGLDDIELRFSANPGQELKALVKVASGGELSRLSLAIQVINARHSPVPVMVFDEVDVGIGGGIAEVVGRLLRELGQHAQVFSITHQPQVAACGHQHLRVEKVVEDGSTRSRVVGLDRDERVEEVARMSGGIDINDATREHARRLLSVSV